MTYEEMRRAADSLADLMLAKGLVKPRAQIGARSHESEVFVIAQHDVPGSDILGGFIIHRDDDPAAAIEAMRAEINAMPTAEETRRNRATVAIAKAIEAARGAGLDADVINPLKLAALALSRNALEGPKPEAGE